jgi:hypothetical protein
MACSLLEQIVPQHADSQRGWEGGSFEIHDNECWYLTPLFNKMYKIRGSIQKLIKLG